MITAWIWSSDGFINQYIDKKLKLYFSKLMNAKRVKHNEKYWIDFEVSHLNCEVILFGEKKLIAGMESMKMCKMKIAWIAAELSVELKNPVFIFGMRYFVFTFAFCLC